MYTKFYKDIQFWIHNAAQIAVVGITVAEKMPPNVSAILMAIIGGAYIIARGIGKIGTQYNSNEKPFYTRSEFYIMCLGAVISVVSGLEGVISAETSASIMAVLMSLYKISSGVSKLGDPNKEDVMDLIDREDDQTFNQDLKNIINKDNK